MAQLIIALIFLLVAATTHASPQRTCRLTEAMTAEDLAASLEDWNAIRIMSKRFAHCDDGAISEGFTESVTSLLVSRWGSLPELSAMSRDDPTFRSFWLRHINASADEGNLNKIAQLGKARCPIHERMLCEHIRGAALRALVYVP